MKTLQLKNILPLLALLATLSACSPQLQPFTQGLYDDYNWSQEDLQRIQFYLSEDITLRRRATKGSSTISRGEIKIVNGEKIEQVFIPKGTPGVLLFMPRSNRFAVSFDESNDQDYLMFGPSQKANDKYVLLASDWNRHRGKVTYGGQQYTTPSESAWASLLVDLHKIRRTKTKSRRAKGRTVK